MYTVLIAADYTPLGYYHPQAHLIPDPLLKLKRQISDTVLKCQIFVLFLFFHNKTLLWDVFNMILGC